MNTDLTFDDFKTLENILVNANFDDDTFMVDFNDFLKERKDDYYYYGYESKDTKYIEIKNSQLEKILRELSRVNRKYPHLFKCINSFYQFGRATHQESGFLFGRNRIE